MEFKITVPEEGDGLSMTIEFDKDFMEMAIQHFVVQALETQILRRRVQNANDKLTQRRVDNDPNGTKV